MCDPIKVQKEGQDGLHTWRNIGTEKTKEKICSKRQHHYSINDLDKIPQSRAPDKILLPSRDRVAGSLEPFHEHHRLHPKKVFTKQIRSISYRNESIQVFKHQDKYFRTEISHGCLGKRKYVKSISIPENQIRIKEFAFLDERVCKK